MSKPAKLDLRWIISVQKSDTFAKFSAHLVQMNEEGSPRNLRSDYRFDAGYGLADLQVTAQADLGANGTGNWYGIHIEYRDVFSVNAKLAEAMVKVLRKVTKTVEAAGENLDYLPNLEAALDLACRSLGISVYRPVLLDAGSNGTGRWGYDGTSYTPLTVGEAATWADDKLAELRGGVRA